MTAAGCIQRSRLERKGCQLEINFYLSTALTRWVYTGHIPYISRWVVVTNRMASRQLTNFQAHANDQIPCPGRCLQCHLRDRSRNLAHSFLAARRVHGSYEAQARLLRGLKDHQLRPDSAGRIDSLGRLACRANSHGNPRAASR